MTQASEPMRVRFVCPVCGGPHARADHPATEVGDDVWRQLEDAARQRIAVQQRLERMTVEELMAMRHTLEERMLDAQAELRVLDRALELQQALADREALRGGEREVPS